MALKRIQPVGQKLLVSPLKKVEEKLDSNIVIAETVNADLTEGIVEEIGDAVQHLYKKGDKVLFPTGAGQGQFLNGKHYLWLDGGDDKTLSNIWGIVVKDEATN